MARYTVQRVRLNAGGYDSTGTYWGQDRPLYWIASPDGTDDEHVRASDHKDALRQAKRLWPSPNPDGFWTRDIKADHDRYNGEL